MRHPLPALLLLAALLLGAATAPSQHLHTAPSPAIRTAASTRAVPLPVTHVSLYKNGIGFFEHTGHVSGDSTFTLDFTTAQLDDVLQSLTAIDLNGGRISGADYNSTAPLDQQLKNLALGLPADTTFAGFLTALRGSRVEVSGSDTPFTGRLMDVEMHQTRPGKADSVMTEIAFVSVVSDSGTLRIFPVTPALSVRLLDTALHTEVTRYLQLLNSSHNQGLRHLTLRDRGAGAREIHLSYLSEVPVWKSTYRILFTDAEGAKATSSAQSASGSSAQFQADTATLQGWSAVNNTTGFDWINVHLSLIAGVPQSLIQPLSQPIYGRRPVIPIAQNPQLTPQTYDGSLDAVPSKQVQVLKEDGPPPSAGVAALSRMPNGSQGGSLAA